MKPSSHYVYFDNFSTSRDLLVHLRNLGYRETGTIQDNHIGDCPLECAKEFKKKDRGSFVHMFDRNEVLYVRWNDNKCITIGSNFDALEPLVMASRWRKH